MFDSTAEDLTDGRLLRGLVVLAVPLLAQNAVQVVQRIVDVVFLGRYGADAVAAVGLATPLVGLLYVTLFVPFVGTQVVVSRRVGADDPPAARRALVTGLGVAIALGVAGGGLALVGVGPALDVLTLVRPTARGGIVAPAAAYLSVLAVGLPVLALTDTVEGGFVAWGDSRASLYLNVVSLGGNVVLDPVFIFGLGPVPELGVAGAALATVLGSTAGLAVGLVMIARGRNGGMLSRAALGVDREAVRGILDAGGPVGAQQGARHLIRLPIYVLVFFAGGAAGLAAYVVGARAATIAFVPPQGLQQAAQSVVSQNLGADNPARARRTTWLGVGLAVTALTLIGAGQWLVPEAIAAAFAPTLSGAAFDATVAYLRILAYGYPALGAIYLFEAGFNGASRSRVSFVATLLQYGGVRLPIAAVGVLVVGAGLPAVFWAVTGSNLVAAAGLAVYYHRETADGMMRRAASSPAD
jgi:putative MATE family efflux protein